MCFSPHDEAGFFAALRGGRFDAKMVCSTIDATKATASVAEDKAMITERIQAEIGVDTYNERIRQELENLYKLVAMRAGRHGHGSGGRGGGGHGDHGGGMMGHGGDMIGKSM